MYSVMKMTRGVSERASVQNLWNFTIFACYKEQLGVSIHKSCMKTDSCTKNQNVILKNESATLYLRPTELNFQTQLSQFPEKKYLPQFSTNYKSLKIKCPGIREKQLRVKLCTSWLLKYFLSENCTSFQTTSTPSSVSIARNE